MNKGMIVESKAPLFFLLLTCYLVLLHLMSFLTPLIFYDDPIQNKECLNLAVKNIKVTHYNLNYLDKDGLAILLLLAEKSDSLSQSFFLLKIKEAEIGKWSYPFGLQGDLLKSNTSPVRGISELSIQPFRSSTNSHNPDDGVLFKQNIRDSLKKHCLMTNEDSKSETKEGARKSILDDDILDAYSRKNPEEKKENEISLISIKKLQPINEESESPGIDKDHARINIRKNNDDTDSFKELFESPLNDLLGERLPYRESNKSCFYEFGMPDDQGMSIDKAREILIDGFVFKKYGRMGKPHFRCVWLNGNKISWKNIENNSIGGSIPLAEIKEIMEGRNSSQFKRFPKAGKVQEASSFTIVGDKRTLDLEANEPKKKENFLKALTIILDNFKNNQKLLKDE